MDLKVFPPHIVKQYNLDAKARGGFVYLEIRRTIYGLLQAGIPANKQVSEKLLPASYYADAHTPGLRRHVTQTIQFTLFVENFGIKYKGKKHLGHLIAAIRALGYTVDVDKAGSLYGGITLKWNYKQRYLGISMPGYVAKIMSRFKHEKPTKPPYSPYPVPMMLVSMRNNPSKHSLRIPAQKLTLTRLRQGSR
jgi:hypothetical protein